MKHYRSPGPGAEDYALFIAALIVAAIAMVALGVLKLIGWW